MAAEPRSRRRRRKKILRKNDGSLYDATERRRITPGELRDYVKDGGLFEARRHETGADCTYEVLQDVVGVGLMQNLVPGMGGGQLSGLGGLAGLAGGGGPLSALARVIGDQAGRGDHGWDDWEEPRRGKGRPSDDPAWADGDWSDAPPRRSSRRGSDDWVPDPDFD
jgi:hypothetical protein